MRIVISKGKIKCFLSNMLLFAYNISIVNIQISRNPIPWYIAAGISALMGLFYIKKIQQRFFLFFVVSFVFTAINMLFIGGAEVDKLLLLSLSFFSVLYFINSDIRPNVLLLNATVISAWLIYRYLVNGQVIAAVLNGSSYNYISIYVLIPIILYYVISEINGVDVKLWPSLVAMTICVISTSRSGVLAGTFLAVGVFFVKYLLSPNSKTDAKRLIAAIVIMIAFTILLVEMNDVLQSNYLNKFISYRLNGRGRFEMWGEYIAVALHDPMELLFGVDVRKVHSMMYYGGNPHNLLFATHRLSGIFSLAFLVDVIIRAYIRFIKNKFYLCVIAMTVFIFRGLTDNFIWCSFAMIPFLYVLFADSKVNQKQ